MHNWQETVKINQQQNKEKDNDNEKDKDKNKKMIIVSMPILQILIINKLMLILIKIRPLSDTVLAR